MKRLVFILPLFFLLTCGEEQADYWPKPFGFLRLEFPERIYSEYTSACPYSFEVADYFKVVDKDTFCNMKDIVLDRFNATVNLTYIPVDTNLNLLIERSRQFVYEHSQFADAIEEEVIINNENKTYGLQYHISGDAASPYQFYLTDSVNHFMRGALYFNVRPNFDSVRSSLEYIKEDMHHMLNTTRWKNN